MVLRFFVIARNSSFTYKGRAIDVKQAGVATFFRLVRAPWSEG
jgi:TolB-like protein